MVGLYQVAGVGTKIQRAFAPSPERHTLGAFGVLQESSHEGQGNPAFGQFNESIKGLMINVFA